MLRFDLLILKIVLNQLGLATIEPLLKQIFPDTKIIEYHKTNDLTKWIFHVTSMNNHPQN